MNLIKDKIKRIKDEMQTIENKIDSFSRNGRLVQTLERFEQHELLSLWISHNNTVIELLGEKTDMENYNNVSKQVDRIENTPNTDSTKTICKSCKNEMLIAITIMGLRAYKLTVQN